MVGKGVGGCGVFVDSLILSRGVFDGKGEEVVTGIVLSPVPNIAVVAM
jgi:hypothetical protein